MNLNLSCFRLSQLQLSFFAISFPTFHIKFQFTSDTLQCDNINALKSPKIDWMMMMVRRSGIMPMHKRLVFRKLRYWVTTSAWLVILKFQVFCDLYFLFNLKMYEMCVMTISDRDKLTVTKTTNTMTSRVMVTMLTISFEGATIAEAIERKTQQEDSQGAEIIILHFYFYRYYHESRCFCVNYLCTCKPKTSWATWIPLSIRQRILFG